MVSHWKQLDIESESLKVAEEALLQNDQIEEAIALKGRLLADRVM